MSEINKFILVYLVRLYCTRTKLNTHSQINIIIIGKEIDREHLQLD
jgi:hypothetical protein